MTDNMFKLKIDPNLEGFGFRYKSIINSTAIVAIYVISGND